MTMRITRRELVQRGAAGVTILSLPGLLAACGGSSSGGSGSGEVADVLRFSNWPLYIDYDEKTKKHPTLDQFTQKTGIKVDYFEDINDNASYFAKVQGPLSQGRGIDRDIFVFTDSSRYPQLLVSKEWVEPLDKDKIPNISNLIDAQKSPTFDPDRTYSLPWQSGMTGIAWNEDVTGPVTSIQQLLEDPKLKGKVTMLTEFGDTIGLVMLANGDDPAKVTNASFDRAMKALKKAVDSGQIRQFTGNDYAPLLAKGDILACAAWSGDMVQLQADHPGLKWVQPKDGGMIWTDNMLIPKGSNVYGASVLMNWYYRPDIAAKVEDYVNYICPVVGADKVLEKSDPAIAKNPLIFPTPEILANAHQIDPKAVNNAKYKQQFQNLIGA
jgi:spermidine/putrescine transport system substrate-binding protein